MKKKNIIIGAGISIASIIGGYYLTRYGTRKYLKNCERKIVKETFANASLASNKDDTTKIALNGILKIGDFKMKHKKLYKFAYGKSDRFEPRSQPLFSMKHMI